METKQLSDPRAMRALAHPVRLALIELLTHAGTLTATQASDVLGESPANCAFHLRTLARYGYVEEAGGGRGRERPWRRAHHEINIPAEHDDPQAARAAIELTDFLAGIMLERARSALAARSSWPPGWEDALGQGETISYLDLDEARQLASDLHELLGRYNDRLDHPELRPEGALPVEILSIAYPLLHLVAATDSLPPRPAGAPPAPGQKPGPASSRPDAPPRHRGVTHEPPAG